MKNFLFALLAVLLLSSVTFAGEINVRTPGEIFETGFIVNEGIGIADPQLKIGDSKDDVATVSNKKTFLNQSWAVGIFEYSPNPKNGLLSAWIIDHVKVHYHPLTDLKDSLMHALYLRGNSDTAIYTIDVILKELYCQGHEFKDDLNETHIAYDCQHGIYGAEQVRTITLNSYKNTVSLEALEEKLSPGIGLKTLFPVLSFDQNLKAHTVLFGGP